MLHALYASKGYCVKKILHMTTTSAKYLSPFDNLRWYSFKEPNRTKHPLTLIDMSALQSQTFYLLSKAQIENACRKCG